MWLFWVIIFSIFSLSSFVFSFVHYFKGSLWDVVWHISVGFVFAIFLFGIVKDEMEERKTSQKQEKMQEQNISASK
jgi:membrane protein CcdC involved in cytochrome C biogenesis